MQTTSSSSAAVVRRKTSLRDARQERFTFLGYSFGPELGDHTLDRRGELITAAAHIYRYRLAREPGFADMLIANGRAREVEAGRG